jgi:hypothetical protein
MLTGQTEVQRASPSSETSAVMDPGGRAAEPGMTVLHLSSDPGSSLCSVRDDALFRAQTEKAGLKPAFSFASHLALERALQDQLTAVLGLNDQVAALNVPLA